jgi:3-hydroxyisobutyrate dehydrogenase-like beta-hydroxyacid dehydrogenase
MKKKTSVTLPKRLTVGVLGYGEVGQSIASLYNSKAVRVKTRLLVCDLERDDFAELGPGERLDILHVCIPYTPDFKKNVAAVVRQYVKNGLTIIHSTVPVGTTLALEAEVGHGTAVVHSPVRGVHPKLFKGLKTFVKYIGADHPSPGIAADKHLRTLGITPEVVYGSRTTELLKLLDTTYYGLCIAFHAYASDLCEQENLNFERIMTDANTSYNAGYAKLGMKRVTRPVLYAPQGGVIGGHCVIPNAALLEELYGKDPLLTAILRHQKTYK